MLKKFLTKSEKCLHTPKLKVHIVLNVYIRSKHNIRDIRKPDWEVWLIAYPQT